MNLGYRAHRLAAAAASSIGPRAAQPAGALIGALFHRLAQDRRVMRARHLRRAVGRPLGRAEMESMLARSFRSYGRYWVEVLGAGGMSPDFARTALDIDQSLIEEALAAGKGCILALAHLGNWDLAGAFAAARGFRVVSVAEVLEPRELYEFFVEVRRRLGITIYPLDATGATARALLRELRANAVVALLADRDIAGDGVEVEFFGERTTVPGGPAVLALRTGAPLIAAGVYQRPRGRYEAELRRVEQPVERGKGAVVAMTQSLVKELERLIRRAPEQWHLYQPNWPSDRLSLPDFVRSATVGVAQRTKSVGEGR